jgi:hypothetical protein
MNGGHKTVKLKKSVVAIHLAIVVAQTTLFLMLYNIQDETIYYYDRVSWYIYVFGGILDLMVCCIVCNIMFEASLGEIV